jgi:hypothetical protein
MTALAAFVKPLYSHPNEPMKRTLTILTAALGLTMSATAFAELGSTRQHSEQVFGAPIQADATYSLYRWRNWYIMEWYNSAGRCEISSYNCVKPFGYNTIRQMDIHNLPQGAAAEMMEVPSGQETQRIWQTTDGAYRVTRGRTVFYYTGEVCYYSMYVTETGMRWLQDQQQNSGPTDNLSSDERENIKYEHLNAQEVQKYLAADLDPRGLC